MQAIVGLMLWSLSNRVDSLLLPVSVPRNFFRLRLILDLLRQDTPNVWFITWLFFLLVLFAATQGEQARRSDSSFNADIWTHADIAVDGWALTLLSEENLSYASTAQTVGLNSGYFMSFTVFLAFNSIEFR